MIFWITDGILHKECDWLHMDEGIRFTVQDDSEEFIIPEGVTSFDTDLFDHMPHLRIISIPASVSSVTGFRGMPVPKILVSEENQHYQSREGMVLSKDGNVLHFVSTELEYAVVPDCVHEIASHAFAGCKNLKTVSLPDTLTKIGSSAFSRCSSLEKIVLPNSVEKFEFALFDSCSSLKEIVFPENPNIRQIEGMVCWNCSSLEEVKLPNTIEEIRSKAFEECSSLKSFIFPENLKSIESRAFHNCTSLQSVELPASLEKLETEKDMFGSTGCFEGCKSLRKVIVHGEIRIPAKTFAGCPGLKSMILKSKPSDKLFGDDDPHPVSVNDLSFLPAAWKPLAVAAFAEENGPLDDERAAAHLKYIKANASRLTKIAVEHPSLLRLMCDQLLIKPELIPAYLEAADGNEASVAALTEYRDHRPAKPKVNANTSVTRPKKESAAKGKYNLKLSEKKRTELLEAAVLANDTETVKELFEVYKKFESPDRSLGLACRFCGVQMVQVLLDLGVTFSYGCMQFIFPNCQVSDYSNPVIADDERKKITVLLCERDTELCAQMLYYAILYDDPIVYAALRAHGVIQISPYYTKIVSGKTPRNQLMSFERNDLEYFQNVFIEAGAAKKQRMLSAMLESMPVDIIQFPASVYTDSGKNEFRKEFCAPGLFELCVEKTDLIKKVPKNKLLNALIDQGNASGLSYALAQKWIEGEKNLRALLKQAQKKTDVAPEVIAVLLDRLKAFGDDSFSSEEDLSMDINPLSASALNKIWSTKSLEDGTLIITSYKGEALDILIPETIGKKKVTALAEGVFDPEMARITEEQRKVRKAIVSVEFPGSIREIPAGLFHMGYLFLGSNSHVKKIILHEGTERIAGNAFEGCEITEIDIPESVVEIGSGAFRNCSRLTSVKLPQHLTSLSDSLFSGCTALKKVDIPEHITTLPGMLFRGTGIEEYTIPDHVTSMGAGVFSHCKMLRSVQFHKGISCISEDIFSHSGLKEFIVPEWMTEIGKFAFYGCEALQEVHMPEGIQIGGYAFCGCSALADEEGRIIVRDVYYGPKGGDLNIPVRIPETVQTISIIGENPEIMYRTEARNSIALPRIENVHVGDTFCFGSFPQDEDYHLNPITWKVLEVQDGKAFVLSEKCLVVIHDDLKMKKGTWADSALRKWLNTAFLESAFTKEEQSSIETTTVITPKNKKQHIDGGPDTQDKLFLLSLDEVERLMPEEEDKATTATAYAAVQRGNKRDIFFWLLRTPGKGWGSVAVSLDGLRIATTGNHVGQDLIRPAMVLKLS